jgi:integrase/recombinase XerD
MDFTNIIFKFEKEMVIMNQSKQTIDNYKSSIKKFLLYFNKYPERINKEEIKEYLYILSLKYSPELVIQNIAAIRKFYTLVICQPEKLSGIKNPKRNLKLIEPLSKQEIIKLFSVIKNTKHLLIVKLMYYGALRISELINLKWTDVRRDRGLIFIRCAKGNKDRYVKLYPELIPLLALYYREYKTKELIFDGQNDAQQYSNTSIRAFLKKYSKLARLSSNCNPHKLRHSMATHLHESGIDIRYIQIYLGHKNSKTTERYTFGSNVSISNFINPLT